MNNKILEKIKEDIATLDKHSTSHKLELPEYGSWPESVHQFDEDSINILKTAIAARRPVLLRGDPGTGKSQLARAAAVALNRLFVYEVVNGHTEGQDLLWKFDAVGRLAEAQAMQGGETPEQRETILDTKSYISPGVLWWALCWDSASVVYKDSKYQLSSPEKPEGWEQTNGSVILIDEIDKANAELPNSLLEILGNNSIEIPWLKTTIGGKDSQPPLVIITTNEERELPPAFVRRCLVLNLDLPEEDEALINHLVARGELHFSKDCEPPILRAAAEQLLGDRKLAKEKGVTPPGLAEYLDMLRALSILGETPEEQDKMLKKINKFVLRKYPVMNE